jgi:hypothetical protein
VISKEEGEAMTREYGREVLFIEASAKGNINVGRVGFKSSRIIVHVCFRFLRTLWGRWGGQRHKKQITERERKRKVVVAP